MPAGPDRPGRPARRSVLLLGLGAALGAGGAAAGYLSRPPSAAGRASGGGGGTRASGGAATGDRPEAGTPRARRNWLSGAAGPSVTDGSFAAWRGLPVPIIGTWADNNEAMVELWQLQPGADLGDWTGHLDIAIGAIGDGESWQAAARGDYDERWRASLVALAGRRAGATGTTYLRFAHEANGDWYPWSFTEDSVEDFVTAWRRFRELQRSELPAARLVFSVNRETVGAGVDWRASFPGAEHVDVMAVDYYNRSPLIRTLADWERSLTELDPFGAPKGLARHQDFARSVGLPFAVTEWSSDADLGESPLFMELMYEFFGANGGTGPGEVLYEIQFNIDLDEHRWSLFPVTRMPESAAAYQRLWRA